MDNWTVKKAMLGDKEAAKRLTERGEMVPCPGCNGSNIRSINGYDDEVWYECGDCHWEGPYKESERSALGAWNTRPQLLTKEQIEALERMEENGQEV